jgi:hypothetical protein
MAETALKCILAAGLAALVGAAGCMTPAQSPYSKNSSAGASTSGAASLGASYSAVPSPSGTVSGGTIDSAQSQGLSDYLKHHQLPLVSGQVVTSPSGGRQVILLGFVASNYGKTDAEVKAQTYLKDKNLVVDNRIKVSPELAGAKSGGGSDPTGGASAAGADPYATSAPGAGSVQDYQNNIPPDAYAFQQQQQYQQYNSPQPSMLMTILPLLGMIGGSYGGSGVYTNYGGFSSGYAPSYGRYGYPSYPPPSPGFGPYPSYPY